MHAKVLVVDRRTALVGSANLTGHALERNLECGLLVRGGRSKVHHHQVEGGVSTRRNGGVKQHARDDQPALEPTGAGGRCWT
ncbi:phospholipase D-like domain-containing protein [Nocardioides immobilis]